MKSKLPRVSEKQEQAAIVQLIESIGGRVYKLGGARKRGDFPGTMQTQGLPDLWAFLPPIGAFTEWTGCWIEVKAKFGRLRDEQKYFEQMCIATDGLMHYKGGVDGLIVVLQFRGWLK